MRKRNPQPQDPAARKAYVQQLAELYPNREAFMKEINRIKDEFHESKGIEYSERTKEAIMKKLKQFANAKLEPENPVIKAKTEQLMKIVNGNSKVAEPKLDNEEKISPKAQKVLAELREKTAELRIGYES